MTTLPSYIDPELWTDFIDGRREMQKKSRVPFTAVAQKRILMKLMKLHDEGYDANQALEDAICNSWRSVFPPKQDVRAMQANKPAALSFQEQDRLAKMVRWEQMTGRQHPDRVQHAPTVIDMFDPQDRRLGYGSPAAPH